MDKLTYITIDQKAQYKNNKNYVDLSYQELQKLKIFFSSEKVHYIEEVLKDGKYMYVMNKYGDIFALMYKQKYKNLYKHPSLSNKQEVASAGDFNIKEGEIIYINNKSGHYRPDKIHLTQFLHELSLNIDISKIEVNNVKEVNNV
tara:strand:- start:1185 stop:1619 length:435 start_codon:yes stop_codon:yes gene_type:complete